MGLLTASGAWTNAVDLPRGECLSSAETTKGFGDRLSYYLPVLGTFHKTIPYYVSVPLIRISREHAHFVTTSRESHFPSLFIVLFPSHDILHFKRILLEVCHIFVASVKNIKPFTRNIEKK